MNDDSAKSRLDISEVGDITRQSAAVSEAQV